MSDLEMSEQETYELYKKKEIIGNLFDSYKLTLYADRLYFHSDENVFGHVFIAFLSIYAYCKIESILKRAKLNKILTQLGLLFEFSKVYHVDFGEKSAVMKIFNRFVI
jgi:transposase